MVATSPFSACISPQNDDPTFSSSSSSRKIGVRPPHHRPHTTTAATSKRHLWDDIRDLTTDVKDGVLGLKEVWLDNNQNPKNGKCSFIDDLSEFVEPHFESLGIGDAHHRPHTTANAVKDNTNSGNAKFFTFDKMERLLNYCVPLSVDPRSPKSRVRDIDENDNGSITAEDIVEQTSSESKKEEEDIHINATVTADDLKEMESASIHNTEHLHSTSGESMPGFSEGLLEHTNRLREKMMDRSRNRTAGPSSLTTTAAGMLERRMDLQGRRSGSSSSEEGEHHHRDAENPVMVPGGLWSIPSEERYGNSLSQSFADSRSMISSGSEERHNGRGGGLKNAYYCGTNKMDDVLMMRSMSGEEDASDENSGGSFPSNGSDLTDLMNSGRSRGHERVDGFEKQETRKMNLVLDTQLDLDKRDDMDDFIHGAAMNAMNGLLSPRSLASEDKYMMGDDDDDDEKVDRLDEQHPYTGAHELSHYRRDARELVSMYDGGAAESRDDNEAANRHFDSLMSDFELNLNRDEKRESKSSYGKSFQEKKQVVKRSREKKINPNASPVNIEDDSASKTSHASNFSTATFLHQTTMGRKLNRSSPSSTGSLGGSVAGSRESVLDRARQAVTQVHQAMDSIGGEDIRNHERPAPVGRVEPSTRSKHIEPRTSSTGTNLHESTLTAMATYKQRLMEQRSRRIQRDIAAKEREGDIEPGEIKPAIAKTNHAPAEPQNIQGPAKESPAAIPTVDMTMDETAQDETNLDICDSGVNSFDSSVNWDALAYSMSGSMSMNEVQAPQPQDALPETKRPDPVDNNKTSSLMRMAHMQMQRSAESTCKSVTASTASNPQHEYPALTRIEEIKKQHDEKMVQIRSPQTTYQPETYQSDAPDDECGPTTNTTLNSPSQEENRPMSPNSIESNDYLSPKSTKASMSDAVQRHIEAMKRQIEKEMMNNEQHSKFTPKSTSSQQGSNRFNFDSPSQPSKRKSLKPSTEDLMLNNLQLEEEMEQIRALSPRSPDSWSSARSPLSTKFGDHKEMEQIRALSPRSPDSWSSPRSPLSTRFGDHRVSSPRSPRVLSPKSPKSPRNSYTPSFMRSNDRKLGLNVEIPVSPISTPRRTLRSTNSSSPKSSRLALSPRSPTEERVRTRISDLMAEVKGFLAENDRARERIARDMNAMQTMHDY